MDEGLNTFLQSLAEIEWEEKYPSRRGEPKDIVEYMTSDRQVPIMTNSESLLQFGNNAYAKPATALNILRSTILGEELFDEAFREYARRWMFKHNAFDALDVTPQDRTKFVELVEKLQLEEQESRLLGNKLNFYVVDFENIGGLVMPLILDITYDGKDTERVVIPAEIWRRSPKRVGKLFMTEREITAVALDPQWETADADRNNNWPAKAVPTRFELFKEKKDKNAMQQAAEAANESSKIEEPDLP